MLKAYQDCQSEIQKIDANSKKRTNQTAGAVCEHKTDQDIGWESDCVCDAAQNIAHSLAQNFIQNTTHNQNSISESDTISNFGVSSSGVSSSYAYNNFDVDPITGEIQLRFPLPFNETQPVIKPLLAQTVATGNLHSIKTKHSTAIIPVASTSSNGKRSSTISLATNERLHMLPIGPSKRARTIPNTIRHAVWWRDNGQFKFIYLDGQVCGERMGLEIDHKKAFAQGGEHSPTNLRLRCRQHNAYHSTKTFGRSDGRTGI
jgi:hypothetical protein